MCVCVCMCVLCIVCMCMYACIVYCVYVCVCVCMCVYACVCVLCKRVYVCVQSITEVPKCSVFYVLNGMVGCVAIVLLSVKVAIL